MPSTVPSSLDGWWSDYKSEIGFLGFSYAVDGCMSLYNLDLDYVDNMRSSPCGLQARAPALLRASSLTSETGSMADTFVCMAHATETISSTF